jgi:hypothetical protein
MDNIQATLINDVSLETPVECTLFSERIIEVGGEIFVIRRCLNMSPGNQVNIAYKSHDLA